MISLRRRLLALRRRDEETRSRLALSGELFRGYAEEMERVHRENAETLQSLMEVCGWPGLRRAGDDGAEAAWIVAQHAIGLPEFQRRCRAALTEAVRRDDAPRRHLAGLIDRIRFNERRPQWFGTIFDWDDEGRMSPWPIEVEEEVDARRAWAALPGLRGSVREMRRIAKTEGQRPPADLAARRRELAAWSRQTGWKPRLPNERGNYVLVFRLRRPRSLTFGRGREASLAAGHHLYVGSAFGPGGLAGRLSHHLRPLERTHWHVDQLRRVAELTGVWCAATGHSREHDWARLLLDRRGHRAGAERFGASDCRCASHLIHTVRRPTAASFRRALKRRWPDERPGLRGLDLAEELPGFDPR